MADANAQRVSHTDMACGVAFRQNSSGQLVILVDGVEVSSDVVKRSRLLQELAEDEVTGTAVLPFLPESFTAWAALTEESCKNLEDLIPLMQVRGMLCHAP
jgi:hypothetical protein